MSATCFEPDGSSSGGRLYLQLWYGIVCVTVIGIRCVVGRRVHIAVYTTVLLKMKPWVRNM